VHRPGRAIEAAHRYWTYPRLEQSDRLQIRELSAARLFLLETPGLLELADRDLQRQLVQLKQAGDPVTMRLALACLRCFVCHQIQRACLELEQQFGIRAGFKRADLYPHLLDDPDPMAELGSYQPLTLRILRQFDPQQSNLSTWTKRLVWQDKALNHVLLEDYGTYIATDWSLLLQATPERLRRLLARMLMPAELEQYCQLLESFQRVYRGDRLAQRLGGSRCGEPTAEQLQRMLAELPASDSLQLLKNLRQLAQHLRQLKAKPLSLDLESIGRQAEQKIEQGAVQSAESEQTQEQFLSAYRQVAQACLQQTVDRLLAERVVYLQRRGRTAQPPKHQAYLRAMQLFHGQGQSMSQIAPQVGLTQQYQVSRLLELPELQADLHQRWLLRIGAELPQLLQEIFEPEQLEQLEQERTTFMSRLANAEATEAAKRSGDRAEPDEWRAQIRRISADLPCFCSLSALIDRLLDDYRAEVYSPNRTGSTGQIALCICQSLNQSLSQAIA
jgi:hypothetical protein